MQLMFDLEKYSGFFVSRLTDYKWTSLTDQHTSKQPNLEIFGSARSSKNENFLSICLSGTTNIRPMILKSYSPSLK